MLSYNKTEKIETNIYLLITCNNEYISRYALMSGNTDINFCISQRVRTFSGKPDPLI